HCVYLIVADAVGLVFLVERHQVRIYLGYFLCDQTKLWPAFSVSLVVKGHGLECQDHFAGFAHRFDVVLETARGCRSSHLAVYIDCHGEMVWIERFFEDMPDITTVGHIHARDADTNRVTSCDHIETSVDAHSDVVATSGVVDER